MKEKINKLYTRKWIRFGLIPFTLLLLWLGLTFLYIITFDTSLTVLSYNHGKESFNRITFNKLLAGDKISGEFKAQENNLGILSIKFQTYIKPPYLNEDTIVFRLKEKGKKNWYYENTYKDGLIYDVPFFPFGFPKINDSKGKIYSFEVQSLNGNVNNSVALSNKSQILFSKYQVSKFLLLHSKREFAIFIVKKFMSSILTTDVRFSSLIYLLPFIFYLLWLSPFKKKILEPFVKRINRFIDEHKKEYPFKFFIPILKFVKHMLIFELNWILIFTVLIDIFIIQLTNDVVYLVIMGLWIVTLRAYKQNSKQSFLTGIMLLLIPPVFLFMKDEPTAEKASIWAFMFLMVGTIQAITELRSEKQTYEKD